MATINMSVKQYAAYQKKLGAEFMPAVRRGMLDGAMRSVGLLVQRTRNAPPGTPRGLVGAFDTGALARGWKAQAFEHGVRIFNDMFYAAIIEFGRRAAPVSREGQRQIALWAQRRLGLTEKDARSTAFLIARRMKQRPQKGRFILTGATDQITKMVYSGIEEFLGKALKGHGA